MRATGVAQKQRTRPIWRLALQVPRVRAARMRRDEKQRGTPTAKNTQGRAAPAHVNDSEGLISSRGLHVHFGAGRLGCGLIIPAIAESQVPFVVLQPPFEEFKPLVQRPEERRHEPVQVYVNGVSIRGDGLRVITTDTDTIGDSWPFRNYYSGSLVLTEPGTGLWEMVVRSATSFSTSVGPALPVIVGDLLVELLPEVDAAAAPVAYCCENDHAAVDELAAKLNGRVEVVHCMVDRICSSRRVLDNFISVTTEPWGGTIVPLTPRSALKAQRHNNLPMPFAGSALFLPRVQQVADYLKQRKLLLVNSMHTVLALMTLEDHKETNRGLTLEELLGEPDDSCLAVPLASPATLSAVRKTELRAWMLAQLLVLQSDFPTAIMLEANGLQDEEELCRTLVSSAERTVSRFNAVTDDCSRVLGAGVALRVEGRILPTYNAVCALRDAADDAATDGVVSPQSSTATCRVLTHAGMSIHEVCFMCSRLAEFGRHIAAADMLRKAGSASPEAQETIRTSWLEQSMQFVERYLHGHPAEE